MRRRSGSGSVQRCLSPSCWRWWPPTACSGRRGAQVDLSARAVLNGPDEIGRLARAFDEMAEKLELAFARERALEEGRRELITAVSHDLRTPLATTRAMVEALADGVVTQPAE